MTDRVEREVVLASGTFRIVGTRSSLRAIIQTDTALGTITAHVEITPSPALRSAVWERLIAAHERLHRERPARPGDPMLPQTTGGFFDDIGHFGASIAKSATSATRAAVQTVEHAAHGAGDSLLHAAKAAADHATSQIDRFAHTIPDAVRDKVTAAARIISRAHLGDIHAAKWIRDTVDAAKQGVDKARHAADFLLQGSQFAAKYLDLPSLAAQALNIPGVTAAVAALSPFRKYSQMIDALRKGDLKSLERMAKEQLSLVQSVVSLVPGIGTGISAGLSAALAVLEGGGPLDIAIRTAYGAIPIPPGLRSITDTVLDEVLLLLHGGSLTDVALVAARDRVPAGFPRDVFDTLAQVIIRHKPIVRVADDMIRHYVSQYAAPVAHLVPPGLEHAVNQVAHYGSLVPSAIDQVAAHAAHYAALAQGAASHPLALPPAPFGAHP